MKRISATLFLSGALGLLGAGAAPDVWAQDRPDPQFEAAYLAWDRGDYIPALEGFARVLDSPAGDRYLERIATITGEYFTTTEVAPDGRALRLAPQGGWAAYEVGMGSARTTQLVAVAGARRPAPVALRGAGLVFSPTGDRAAYLALRETGELTEARQALEQLITSGADRQTQARQRALIAYLETRDAEVVLRELRSGKERRLAKGGLIVAELAFGTDGSTIYATAAADGDAARSDIYKLSEKAAPVALTEGPGHKLAPVAVRGGTYLVYQTSPRGAVIQRPGTQDLAQRASGELQQVVIHNLETGRESTHPGIGPAIAEDGSAVAFLTREGIEGVIRVVPLRDDAAPRIAVRTTDPISPPAISPDGRRVAYQRALREDWEIFLAEADGSGEMRVTYDVQHDLFPQFVSPDTLLYIKGEGRHRRSYLYDVPGKKEIRLFHNNTLRTIAPEYEWEISADGARIMIVSERDGDTISPERGVYVVDLRRPITKAELHTRIRENLAAERDLRARGEAIFAPIAEDVRQAVAAVSKTKLYEYQDALHRFDSKHMTKPGNLKAAEYLFNTLKSWGYEPEYQWFEPMPGVRTANVIARLPGTTHPDLVYVVGSHFDSVEDGPGADDDTSGTAVLLETARVLKDRPRAATVLFVFYTGEESGLRGSREFTRRALADGMQVVGALNNDMIGYANDHRHDNTIRYSNDGIRDLQHAAAFLFTELITYDARYYKGTDAHALFDAFGDVIGGIGSYPVLASPHYHQPHDVLEIINHELMRETAKTNVATVMLLASSPARLKGLEAMRRGDGVDLTWSPAPEEDLSHYVVAYGPEADPLRHTTNITEPRARIEHFMPGMVISVRAVSRSGLVGWDWARVVIR
jgi:Tol biopolymer transport system component